MASDKILEDNFSTFSCFKIYSFKEISELLDNEIDEATLKKILFGKSPFIPVENESSENGLFVLESVLFRWYCRLNLRLAQVRQFALSRKQVISLLNQLCNKERGGFLPLSAIEWGGKLGLILPTISGDRYVFPLSKVISLMRPFHTKIVAGILDDLYIDRVPISKLKQESHSFMESGFSKFNNQTCDIVKSRQRLSTERKKTLQEMGSSYQLTRERIRQIETNFWLSLEYDREATALFIKAFILDYFGEAGSMIVNKNSQEINYRIFLAKCISLPCTKFDQISLTIIGLSTIPIPIQELGKLFPNNMDAQKIANQIELNCPDHFSSKDLKLLSNRVAQYARRSLSRSQKAYLALRTIGRPAHYTKISEVYNSLWPECPLEDISLLGVLSQHGQSIVWIGIDGTYALKEWGYERPSKDLFQTVADIVNEIYKKTNCPVQFTVIQSELSKYRKIVKGTSLSMALQWNPRIKRVGKNLFVPKEPDKTERDDRSLEELDKILGEFQKDSGEC